MVNVQHCHLCKEEMSIEDMNKGYFRYHKETYDRVCMNCVRKSY